MEGKLLEILINWIISWFLTFYLLYYFSGTLFYLQCTMVNGSKVNYFSKKGDIFETKDVYCAAI